MAEQAGLGHDAAVKVGKDGAVAIIQLNRPERLNAVDAAMIADLHAAIMSVDRDAAVRAVLLTGAGRSFMAGADISLFERNLEAAPATASGLIDGFHAMLRALRAMEKPVVAALQGAVAGGGFGLALACDLCVMADDAQLISAYSKLGTSPDGGTTWSLTQLLGRRRALDVMWLNEPIGAAEAHRLGLVNRIVPPARLQDEALALAQRLAEGAPQAMARIKTLVEVAATSSFDEQLDREKTAFVASAAEADFREGIAAFFARRTPRFTGR